MTSVLSQEAFKISVQSSVIPVNVLESFTVCATCLCLSSLSNSDVSV